MSDSVITAIVGGVVSIILGGMQVWMTLKLRSIGKTTELTHEIVNSQRTAMEAKIDGLRDALAVSKEKEKPETK
jgi:hypothetical protein